MKLAYLAHIRLPTDRAHGYAIMKMCEEFAGAGTQVELITPVRRHGIQDDPFRYYRIRKNFSIRRLWTTDFTGKFERSRFFFLIDQLIFIVAVLRLKFSNEVVYTRDYQLALVARASSIVLEVHMIPERHRLFMRAARRAKKVIAISAGLKEALIERGLPADKIAIAHDAVDTSEFKIDPSREIWRHHGVDPSKKIVLYTGHFYGWKGAETLAKAAPHLSDAEEIVLMGGVDDELAMFKKEYSRPNVHIIGYQPRETMAEYLMAADLLILPNSGKAKISSHYTSPLKLFQYMASGVPMIASDLPSIREVLTNENAFWFTPDDERSLATQIEFVLSQPEQSRMKAARARDDVKKYTWDARAKKIMDFIAVPR